MFKWSLRFLTILSIFWAHAHSFPALATSGRDVITIDADFLPLILDASRRDAVIRAKKCEKIRIETNEKFTIISFHSNISDGSANNEIVVKAGSISKCGPEILYFYDKAGKFVKPQGVR